MTLTRQQRRASERAAAKAARSQTVPHPTKPRIFVNPSTCSHPHFEWMLREQERTGYMQECPDCGSRIHCLEGID